MSVKLRFVRIGKKNRPLYRLCAMESRRARDGQYLESLGFYDPYITDDQKKFRLDKERAEYWLSVGAIPSPIVLKLFKREKVAGLIRPKPKRKRRKAKAAATSAAASTKKPKPPKKPKTPTA